MSQDITQDMKSAVCSCRRPESDSTPTLGSSQLPVVPPLGDLAPSAGLRGLCTHMHTPSTPHN